MSIKRLHYQLSQGKVLTQDDVEMPAKKSKANRLSKTSKKKYVGSGSSKDWTANSVGPYSTYRVQRFQIAPKMITRMMNAYQGFLPVGAPATGYCVISANTFYEPFFFAGASISTMLTGTDGSSNTSNYNGYSVTAGMYQNYKILKSHLKVRAVSAANGDTMSVWTYPYNLSAPAGLLPPTIISHLGIPGMKKQLVSSGAGEVITNNQVKISELLGLSPRQYEDQPNVGYGLSPPASQGCNWCLQYATVDGVATSAQVYFFVELDCEIEFTGSLPFIQ